MNTNKSLRCFPHLSSEIRISLFKNFIITKLLEVGPKTKHYTGTIYIHHLQRDSNLVL